MKTLKDKSIKSIEWIKREQLLTNKIKMNSKKNKPKNWSNPLKPFKINKISLNQKKESNKIKKLYKKFMQLIMIKRKILKSLSQLNYKVNTLTSTTFRLNFYTSICHSSKPWIDLHFNFYCLYLKLNFIKKELK